jgi:hypothetical protein
MERNVVSRQPRWQLSGRLWLSVAAVTFVAYIAVVIAGSGDLAALWIVGFVLVGWPTMIAGVLAALAATRRADPAAPAFLRMVGLSLLAWGAAAVTIELVTSREYVPATLLWMAAPTALSSVAVWLLAHRGRE